MRSDLVEKAPDCGAFFFSMEPRLAHRMAQECEPSEFSLLCTICLTPLRGSAKRRGLAYGDEVSLLRFVLILFTALTVFWVMQPSSASASTVAVTQSYYDDPSGLLSLEDVSKKQFEPFSGQLGAGYGSSAYWIQLKFPQNLEVDPDRRHALVLRVTPTFIDQVAVYQTCHGRTEVQYIGDQYPISEQAYPALSLNLFLEPCALANPIWLRLVSTSSRSVTINVMPIDEAIKVDFHRFMFVLLSLGIIAFFLLLIILYDANIKDQLLIAFALQQVALMVVIYFNTGFARISLDLSPDYLDRLSSFVIVLVELTLLYFNFRVLQKFRVSSVLRPVVILMMAITIVNLVLVFSPWRGEVMLLNAAIVSFSIVFFSAMTFTIRNNNREADHLPRRLVSLYFAGVAVLIAPSLMTLFGFGQFVQVDAATIYSVFTTIVMSSILIVRARRRARINEEARLEMAVNLQKMKEEKRFRDQQEQLFTMLVHEVKTPIAALKIAMSNASSLDVMRDKATRHLDTVISIINHCNQAYRLEDPSFKVSLSQVNLSKLIERAIADHDIDISFDHNVPEMLETDPQLFHAIVGNLVDNADRYKAHGSTPQLTVRYDNNGSKAGIVIEIRNLVDASGIPDERQIFRKYYRSSNAHHMSGSGLGLFLAHSSALRLGGELQYVFDGQVRFRLWLPV